MSLPEKQHRDDAAKTNVPPGVVAPNQSASPQDPAAEHADAQAAQGMANVAISDADRARIAAIAEDLDGGEPSPEQKKKGIGKPPSAKDQAEVMELFREENGGPGEPSPEQKKKGIGKPPSAKDQAEVMQIFREVNGGPGEPSPEQRARIAAIAQDLDGGVPSAADKARIAAIAQDLEGSASASAPAKKKTVGVPSAAGRAEAMEPFQIGRAHL